MSDTPFTGITREAWLLMLHEGGRWKTAEIAGAVKGDASNLHAVIRRMKEKGHVIRFKRDQYGVTADCKLPRGLTVADVMHAPPEAAA